MTRKRIPPPNGSDGAVIANAVPLKLRQPDQWVCWDVRERDGTSTKVPVDPATGEFASTADPDTWASFEDALATASESRVFGVGFVFTADDPFVGVDLDNCRQPVTGELSAPTPAILTRLCSYTELSPTGTGLHVLARGELPAGRRRHDGIEMYADNRFFTVTGARLEWLPGRVAKRPAELRTVHEQYVATADEPEADQGDDDAGVTPDAVLTDGPTFTPRLDDDELIERAKSAANGEKFERLWNGDTSSYPSHSEADMALCCLLAFWTNGDPQRVDRLFRKSGLMRDKWDEVHYADGATYGERTAARACKRVSDGFDMSE